MSILESDKPVTLSQREIAVLFAQTIAKSGLPVPSDKYRNDVDYIQIDPIIIEVKVTKPRMGVRLQFMTKGDFGVSLNIDLDQFEADPKGYTVDLFENLGRMLRDSDRLRCNKRFESASLYDMLTKGAAANG